VIQQSRRSVEQVSAGRDEDRAEARKDLRLVAQSSLEDAREAQVGKHRGEVVAISDVLMGRDPDPDRRGDPIRIELVHQPEMQAIRRLERAQVRRQDGAMLGQPLGR